MKKYNLIKNVKAEDIFKIIYIYLSNNNSSFSSAVVLFSNLMNVDNSEATFNTDKILMDTVDLFTLNEEEDLAKYVEDFKILLELK